MKKQAPSQRASVFARRVCGPVMGLTTEHFRDEARFGSIAYHLIEGLDLSRFHRPRVGELPLNQPGLTVWRLRPKDARTAEEIDGLILPALFRSCGKVCVVSGDMDDDAGEIRYRYVLPSGTHAHAGEIVVGGPHVKKVLSKRRERLARLDKPR